MGEGDKKVTLTFTLPWTADVEKVDESVIALLFRDALYEFYRAGKVARESSEEYVEKFYDTLTPERKAEKVKDVQNRVKLAKGLCLESVTVEVTPEDPVDTCVKWMQGQGDKEIVILTEGEKRAIERSLGPDPAPNPKAAENIAATLEYLDSLLPKEKE